MKSIMNILSILLNPVTGARQNREVSNLKKQRVF